jgi:hypothetical protein
MLNIIISFVAGINFVGLIFLVALNYIDNPFSAFLFPALEEILINNWDISDIELKIIKILFLIMFLPAIIIYTIFTIIFICFFTILAIIFNFFNKRR